jgi:hypothetical protein
MSLSERIIVTELEYVPRPLWMAKTVDGNEPYILNHIYYVSPICNYNKD